MPSRRRRWWRRRRWNHNRCAICVHDRLLYNHWLCYNRLWRDNNWLLCYNHGFRSWLYDRFHHCGGYQPGEKRADAVMVSSLRR